MSVSKRQKFGQGIARAIEPEAWATYSRNHGRHLANQEIWAIHSSIEQAKRVLGFLEEQGITIPQRRNAKNKE